MTGGGWPTLLVDPRFWPLLAAQGLGRLADGLFRAAVVFFLLRDLALTEAASLTLIAAGVFVLPLVLLAAIAGQVGDRFPRAQVVRLAKLGEIAAMALGALAIALDGTVLLLAALFALGVKEAFFRPAHYALIPELLDAGEVMAANALIAAGAFLAILLGAMIGALALLPPGGDLVAGLGCVLLAVLGWLASRRIPVRPAADPMLPVQLDPWSETQRLIEQVRAEPPLGATILAIAWFWAVGGLYFAHLPAYGEALLGADHAVPALFLSALALGAGLGALLAPAATRRRLDLTPVPFAALAMALASFDLWFAASALEQRPPPAAGLGDFLRTDGAFRLLLDLALVAFAGGLFVVPLYAFLQARAPAARRGRVLAVSVLASALALLTAGLLDLGLRLAGAGITVLFLLTALGNLVVAWLVLRRMPAHVLRGTFQALFKLLFRVEVVGQENIDRAGPRTLVVVNHVSWLDGPLMMAFCSEIPVFAVFTAIADLWWLRPFRHVASIFALDPTNALAMKGLIRRVEQGRPCVIFPEGRLSVTGALMKVYPGPAYIADKADAAIVPVRIDGAELTHLSRLDRGEVRRRWLPKIRITILPARRLQLDPALRGRARREAAGLQLYDIMSDMVFSTTRLGPSLFAALLDARARHGGRHRIVEDFTHAELTYDALVRGALVLGRHLAASTQPGERVGVMLPNTNAAATVFYALQAFGRVPAMLNYTAGSANLEAALTAAEIRVVITSRSFVEQAGLAPTLAPLEPLASWLWLEDVRDQIGRAAKLRGVLDGWRARRIHASFALQRDQAAVVLFTSGSEGRPKGVLLSHGNILANCAQAAARVDYNRRDKVFDALPLFHSFGLTAGFLLPSLFGVGVFLYPSPLHYRLVPEMIYASNSTILFGTNSFLEGYGRSADAYDFRSIRYVFAGAEPIQDDTRQLWADKFGIRLLAGYGTTEAAPVISMNTPMHHRRGTVGRFLPGIAWRLAPITGLARGGRLWIKGPNVMLGYLRAEQPGVVEPPADGWYDTGDIADVDDEGFVTLLGRAKRFAKIGGEMVSLAAAEALAAAAAPAASHAVVALADPRKGERLVLLTTASDLDRATLVAAAKRQGLATLMVPAEVRQLAELPLLASGKVDHAALARLAGAAAPRDGGDLSAGEAGR